MRGWVGVRGGGVRSKGGGSGGEGAEMRGVRVVVRGRGLRDEE